MSGILFRLLLTGIVILLFYIRYRMKRKQFYDVASKMPGPRSYPFIGDILTFARHSHQAINIGMKYVRRFKGRPIRFWFLTDLIVFLTNPSDVEIVLSNMKQFKKPWQYKVLTPFMGKGLFTSDDYAKWKLHRKAITPAFHFNILKGFIPTFFEETTIFVEKVIPGEEMDISTMTGLLTLDIICRTAMGVEVHSQSGKGKDFVHGMETLLRIAQNRLTRPWMMNDTIFSWSSLKKEHDEACDLVIKFTENIIKEKKARQNNNTQISGTENKDAGAFLDLMINGENENDMTDDELRDETITIIIGGQETTTTTITFTLLMLALHQEVQQQVLNEVDAVFQGDKTRMTSFEDLQHLEYLERVIKEVMRLYPSIPVFGRVTDEDMDLNGYHLPKGCIAAVFVFGTHRDPKSFPNPDKFDPDNFLPERCRGRSPFAYIPFSAGPRKCIGQKYTMLQLKTLLSTVLRHYKVFPGENIKCFEDVEITMSTTIRSRRPVRLVFMAR